MSNKLGRFEKLIEKLVEGSFARLFSGQLHPQEIVAQISRAMEDGAQDNLAPDYYVIQLNPQDIDQLLATEPELDQILADQVLVVARRSGLELCCNPSVCLQPDKNIPPKSLSVNASVTVQLNEQTRVLDLTEIRQGLGGPPDGTIYLIVEGERHIALKQTVYTLGRRLDCDIVLSDPRVSRRHAQLRWRYGRFILYDLGSTGGTTVNGHPVSEAALEPGDVFSLGGASLIYGQESPDDNPSSEGDTTKSWSGRETPGTNHP